MSTTQERLGAVIAELQSIAASLVPEPAPAPPAPPAPAPAPAPSPEPAPVPAAGLLVFPAVGSPSLVGTRTDFYDGQWNITPGSPYDADGHPYVVRVAVRKALPARPRLCITQHASGGYHVTSQADGVTTGADIEIRGQDGQVKKRPEWQAIYGTRNAEWWVADRNGLFAPQWRNAGTVDEVLRMWPQIDLDRGIIVQGTSMGGAGVTAALLMPAHRDKIAYVRGAVPVFLLPRLLLGYASLDVSYWPPDSGAGSAWWDSWDFALRAESDPVIRGLHYRVQFSTTDWFARCADGNSQVHWVNLLEQHRIGGAATWVANGHAFVEPGVAFPNIQTFEDAAQDVTLDRAHPCFTRSSGNYPFHAADRANVQAFPRGHYNLGLTWDHARIVDTADEIVLPIRYKARAAFGAGIPDQPLQVTVDVTPRRPRRFRLVDGDVLRWSCGDQSGTATVVGDVVTAEGIRLDSGAPYLPLRFAR